MPFCKTQIYIIVQSFKILNYDLISPDINPRNLPNGIIGRDYSSHTSSESSKSLDFKSI